MRELARERDADWLALAGDYAGRMLPRIFRADDPVLAIALPSETRRTLEYLLESLPRETFLADDGLGWVYQFWQADRKKAVNEAGDKIGADELPAVTQLFTEDYMVLFLLHNTLGAWWAGKVLRQHPALRSRRKARPHCARPAHPRAWHGPTCASSATRGTTAHRGRGGRRPEPSRAGPRRQRTSRSSTPAWVRGTSWSPPCRSSQRCARRRKSCRTKRRSRPVLRDNLYGLEIDPRCTQIAAFNLAFAAWKTAGHRPLPPLNLACSGLAIGVGKAGWLRLAEKAAAAADPGAKRNLFGTEDTLLTAGVEERVKKGLAVLYDLFARAPWLGSLIDPRRIGGDLFREGFDRLEPLFASILAAADTDETREMAVAARGMATAAALLGRRFTLVATNVPFLGRGKQHATMRDHLESHFKDARADLATAMLRRLTGFAARSGTIAAVTPQNWLFLKSYAGLRKRLLRETTLNAVAALGPRAFETISGEVANTALVAVTASSAPRDARFAGLDVNDGADAIAKAETLCHAPISLPAQSAQRSTPDQRITLEDVSRHNLLSVAAHGVHGLGSKDTPCFFRQFWEMSHLSRDWEFMQTTVQTTRNFGGMEQISLVVPRKTAFFMNEVGVVRRFWRAVWLGVKKASSSAR